MQETTDIFKNITYRAGAIILSVIIIVYVFFPIRNGMVDNAANAESSKAASASVSVTEITTEAETTTEAVTEAETTAVTTTRPPAAPVTKVYKPKPTAPAPKKNASTSKKVKLNVPLIKQIPSYPTGCEAASATMLLRFYGYNVSLDQMVAAIPRENLYKENGRVYGPSIYEKFVGDPRQTYTDARPGYGAFSPVITKSLNSVIAGKGGKHTAKNISGCSFSTLLSHLNNGRPVIVWATAKMQTPKYVNSWYIKDASGKETYFEYPRGTHVMVLSGYDSNFVYITDPIYGNVKYSHSSFNDKWVLLGKQAIILDDKQETTKPVTESTTEATTEPTTEPTTETTTEPTTESTTEPGDRPTTEPSTEPTTESNNE